MVFDDLCCHHKGSEKYFGVVEGRHPYYPQNFPNSHRNDLEGKLEALAQNLAVQTQYERRTQTTHISTIGTSFDLFCTNLSPMLESLPV